jgi:hypothetical protein
MQMISSYLDDSNKLGDGVLVVAGRRGSSVAGAAGAAAAGAALAGGAVAAAVLGLRHHRHAAGAALVGGSRDDHGRGGGRRLDVREHLAAAH